MTTYRVRVALETLPWTIYPDGKMTREEEKEFKATIQRYKEGERILDVGMDDEEIKERYKKWQIREGKEVAPDAWKKHRNNWGHQTEYEGELKDALRAAINDWEYHLGSVCMNTGQVTFQTIYSVEEVLEDGTTRPVDWLGELIGDDIKHFRPQIVG